MSTTAPKVFISYRRDEAAGHAGRIYDAISARLGERTVFMDVDLAPGIDFVTRITEAVDACDVLLVIIGPSWARQDRDGRPRLTDPGDFVRLEVETALKRPDLTVIPVLVSGGRMPHPDDLPDGMRTLVRRNALELSDLRWRYDIGRLVSRVAEVLTRPQHPSRPPRLRRSPAAHRGERRTILAALAGVLLLGLIAGVLVVAGVFSSGSGSPPSSAKNGSRGSSLKSGDAVRFVNQYARAYHAKDLSGLRRLMSPDVVLKQGSNLELRGTDQVVARYQREFRGFGLRQPTFNWNSDHTDAGQDELEVSGRYAISVRGEAHATGRFGFRLRGIGAELLLTEICLQCPDAHTGGPLGPA